MQVNNYCLFRVLRTVSYPVRILGLFIHLFGNDVALVTIYLFFNKKITLPSLNNLKYN